ncbi:MAG TPA: hypothetical protein DDX02_01845 [Clostridiaceae bacterium]|nr:hypothetical protein [Clostridiaceae bacterium]HBF76561.1 hypothetical protein [Clostridiaceae bacterium]HBG38551.1 hypothetical protein [Clostridiaceae bacterium]
MSDKISSERKAIYYTGMVLVVIGFVLFISTFFTFAAVFRDFGDSHGFGGFGITSKLSFLSPIIGMVLIIIGSILMTIGRKGAAGSGIILDPEKERDDLKPFSSAKGKMINDVVENIDIVNEVGKKVSKEDAKEVVKIKCRNCGALNDEDSKYCKSCGREI